MARFEDNNFSGSLGNVVFYKRDGKNYARMKPGKRKKKRGQAPDRNTSIFGMVSANGSRMLKLLNRQLLFPFSLASYNNGRGWMRNHYAANIDLPQWDITAKPNDMCQLNAAADLRDILFAVINIQDNGNGKIQVTIPSMNPGRDMKKLPARTTSVNMKLAVIYAAFKDNSPVYINLEQYSFDYENTQLPVKEILIDTTAPAGNLAIIVVAIEPVIAGKSITAEWLPAAIIGMGRFK